MNELTALANKFNSDKGDSIGAKHNYTPIYDFLFRQFKDKPIRILEIGLLRGGPELGQSKDRKTAVPPSIQMWLSYFKKATIVGFDISDFSQYQTDRFSFYRGDSGDENSLNKFKELHQPFDIILDDASHASFHQLKAFEMLFPHLKPGGIYIMEDLHWQPPEIEKSLPKTPKGRDFLDWAYGFKSTEELDLPDELKDLPSLYDQISFCQGFTGFRSGAKTIKTAVFAKKQNSPSSLNFNQELVLLLNALHNNDAVQCLSLENKGISATKIQKSLAKQNTKRFARLLDKSIRLLQNNKSIEELISFNKTFLKGLSLKILPGLDEGSQKEVVRIAYGCHHRLNSYIYDNHPPQALEKTVLTKISDSINSLQRESGGRNICLMLVTNSYLKNLELWLSCTSKTQSYQGRILLACLDGCEVETKLLCSQYQNLDIQILPLNPDNLSINGNCRNLSFIWHYKALLTHKLLKAGFNVIYSDLDSFWMQDINPLIKQLQSDSDWSLMIHDNMPLISYIDFGITAGCGFFYVVSKPSTIKLSKRWLKNTKVMLDDQIGFYEMLSSAKISWEVTRKNFISHTAHTKTGNNDKSVLISLISKSAVKRLGTVNDLEKLNIKPIIVHSKWKADKEMTNDQYLEKLLA